MIKPPQLDYRALTAELFIVFIGLFLALQVDEWRENRELDESEVRYLHRLKDDLQAFVEFSERFLVGREKNRAAVQHVSDSFAAGQIIGKDHRKFELGLIYVGHLPDLRLQKSSYDEMVASGMFARLRSEELKTAIAELYATHEQIQRNFSWWRNSTNELFSQLQQYVGPYSEEKPVSDGARMVEATVRRVEFDFEELQGEPSIRNGFFWAADTHNDWIRMTRELLRITEEAISILESELSKR